MTTPVIIDIVTVAVLGGLILFGMMRGLIRAVLGVAVLLLSLWGSAAMAERFLEPVSDFAASRIEAGVQAKLDSIKTKAVESARESAASTIQEASSSFSLNLDSIRIPDIPGLLDNLGMDGETRQTWQGRLQETMDHMTDGVMGTGGLDLGDIIREMIQPFVRILLYAVSFLLLSTVLKILVKPLLAVAELPGIERINRAGGALLGMVEAFVALLAALWVLERFGLTAAKPPLSETIVFRALGNNAFIRSFLA